MEYQHYIYDYRPKDSSFEVEAMLHENDSSQKRGYRALMGVFIGTQNYGENSYTRQMELAFNPVTDKEETEKYIDSKHLPGKIYVKNKKKFQEKKEAKAKEKLNCFLKKTAKKSLDIVIQNLLSKHMMAEHILGKQKVKLRKLPYSFLAINEVNDILENKNLIIKYSIHPHVDSLLKERYGDKALRL